MAYYSPAEIQGLFAESAVSKNKFSTSKLFVYSILGGAFIAIGGLLSLVVVGGMPGVAATNPGITKFLFGALFPIGLILVLIAGAELFTSDCAVIPLGIMNKKLKIVHLLRIWTVVYFGNFVGALLVAYLFAYQTNLLAVDPWLTAARHIGEHKTSGTFTATFIKGMGANWLVCMAVWIAYAAKDVTGKIIGMWFPVMCFVAFGFEQSIANMFFIPLSMLLGAPVTMHQFIISNLIPATLGNIVGGVVFVALPYWFMFSKTTTLHSTAVTKIEPEEFDLHSTKSLKKHLN